LAIERSESAESNCNTEIDDVESWVVVIALLIGLAVGVLSAGWTHRRANRLAIDAALALAGADAQARIAATEARLAGRDAELRDLHARLEASASAGKIAGDALADARVAHATLGAQLRDERDRAAERLATLTQARDELTAHFKALAGDALEVNRQRVTEQHQGALDQILKPLGEKLVAFEKKVEETYDKEAQQRSSLRQEVLNLQAATLQINEDAKNLTLALKGEAKTRGNWGEVVLERVLERSGLVKNVEYHTQHTMKDDDGGVSRPDIVIRLPDNKHVIIDSKVSLVAYDRYHAADDDVARTLAGRQHVEGMRRHARALGDKNYQSGKEVDSPDFVAMFVPIEPAFSLASSLDADLFLDAWDRKVVIVTPSTLLALLMTVQTLWQRDKQTRNAIEIAEQSGALHDQFALVLESLQVLGRQLRDAQKAFELTENRLVDGRGNVVGRIRKLQEMGAKTKKQLPPALLARAADQDRDGAAPTAGVSKLTLVVPPGGDAEH
jgi:DNA recombination protein RmuC